MQVTLDQFNKITGGKSKFANEVVKSLPAILEKYKINTVIRAAHFLAQVTHESGGFCVMTENLNYSADGLLKIFPKYFNADSAASHARNPQMIANRVYSNRLGNGDAVTNDGWNYRGRGFIQLTGKDNYSKFAKSIGKSLDDTIKYLETPQGALESAAWFWDSRNINVKADADDIIAVTKLVNGGTIGLDDRKNKLEIAKSVLVL
jgi:putative chitinase